MTVSSIYSSHRLMQHLHILITFFAMIYNVNCDIFTLNNKYSQQWQTLKTIQLEDSNDGRMDFSIPGSWERVKRDVEGRETSPTSSDSKLVLDRSILNGTETTARAFVHWIGKERSEKLIVLTCSIDISTGVRHVTESHLWSSDDYGTTFHKKSLGKDAKIAYFYSVPTDVKRLIFADIDSKKVYTTVDEVETFQAYDVPDDPDVIVPHPFVKDAILLYSLQSRKLYSSMNFAKTWSLLSANVLQNFFWASKEYDTNPLLVHMEIEGAVPTQSLYKACIAPNCEEEAMGDDSVGPFLTKSLVIHKEFMFVQKSDLYGSESYLMVSYRRGPFQRAFFPGNVKTNDFIILNLDDGQVFIGVNHDDKVNLYLSDETGHYFVESLTDVSHQIIRSIYFGIDLHEVQGMNWTFLANARNSDPQNKMKTYISFDKGGNWAPLQVTDDMKEDCKSKEKCDFRLLIRETFIGSSIISNENAPGIVLAHGFLGSDSSGLNASVFTSRDGGWTWKKAPFNGTFRFNFLDQGSILSAVPDGILASQPSNIMHYSCDEGATWHKEVFDPKGFFVKGVLNEPNILTLTEMLFGQEGKLKPWILVKLDFSNILTRKCETKDYETWFPKDYNSKTTSTCTLGRKLEYTRRKQNASCHNGQIFIPRVKPNENCDCTAEDYECDFGFEEKADSCKKAKWFYEAFLPLDCEEGSNYNKTRGYRKIPADSCKETEADAKKYGKEESSCPVLHPHGLLITSHSSFIVTGKEMSFYLEQSGGSRAGTTYTWNFDDSSPVQKFNDYSNASHVAHIFTRSGRYNVSVTAENSKGKEPAYLSVNVQDRISSVFILSPKAGKVGQPVKISAIVASSSGRRQNELDHVHYVWTFGDEASSDLPTLTWKKTSSHTYKTAGTYDISVEVVNSISSLYQPFQIKIYENAIIMVLIFSDLSIGSEANPIYVSLLLERLQQQLMEDLGVNSFRIAITLAEISPVHAHLYIFPCDDPEEPSSDFIKEKAIALVKSGEFGINLFGKRDEPGKIFKVASIEPLKTNKDDSHGPNMTPVYIGAPVLIIVLVNSVILFFYCRRRVRNVRQFNLLSTQDDSDALLDDDDEAPLDLDIDFGVREPSRDDHMLDGGGNHLVMVTGDRSDGGENC